LNCKTKFNIPTLSQSTETSVINARVELDDNWSADDLLQEITRRLLATLAHTSDPPSGQQNAANIINNSVSN